MHRAVSQIAPYVLMVCSLDKAQEYTLMLPCLLKDRDKFASFACMYIEAWVEIAFHN
jgi:hypothetical protein